MSEPIYLDAFSTTPLSPEAKAAMIEAMSVTGNPASPHSGGERASGIVEKARAKVADLIGAAPSEILFTSGATEANNIAIVGTARALLASGSIRNRILVSAVEHKAVLEPARALEREGFAVDVAPVDRYGRLDLAAYDALLGPDTLLVSLMAANNETGVLQPVREAAALARQRGALFHSDAAQAAGKIPLDVLSLDVDYLSLSAHKCYGPMGVGALYVAATAPAPEPLHRGGGQQGGIRPGTEPVALAAGFGAAAAEAIERMELDGRHEARLAERLLEELTAYQVRFRRITGDHAVVPGSLALALDGVDAEHLCLQLGRRVLLSTGSACTAGQLRHSHVVEAMGISDAEAGGVVRALCHRYLDEGDIVAAAAAISEAVFQNGRVATGDVVQ